MSRQSRELRKAGVKMRVPRQPLKVLEILLTIRRGHYQEELWE
jgi:hypothetical protein